MENNIKKIENMISQLMGVVIPSFNTLITQESPQSPKTPEAEVFTSHEFPSMHEVPQKPHIQF